MERCTVKPIDEVPDHVHDIVKRVTAGCCCLWHSFRLIKTAFITSLLERLGVHLLVFVKLLGFVQHILSHVFKLNVVFGFEYHKGIGKILLQVPEVAIDSAFLFLRVFRCDGVKSRRVVIELSSDVQSRLMGEGQSIG